MGGLLIDNTIMKKMDQPHVDGIRRGEKTLHLKLFDICKKAMEFG